MKLIDLTQNLTEKTPVYPGDIKTDIEAYKNIKSDGYRLNLLTTGLHTGTHIDFPAHVLPEGCFASAYAPDCFMGKGVLLDVRHAAVIKKSPDDEARISQGDIVLLYTGYDAYYSDHDRYFNHHPVLDGQFADFLVKKGIKMLGMDTAGPERDSLHIHKTLLSNGILLLENLTGLGGLLHTSFEIYAFPLKIACEASLVRVVARIITNGFGHL